MQLNGYVYEYQGKSKSPYVIAKASDSKWEIACVTVEVKRYICTRTIDSAKVCMFEGVDGKFYACTQSGVRNEPGLFHVVATITKSGQRLVMSPYGLTEFEALVTVSKYSRNKHRTISVEKVEGS